MQLENAMFDTIQKYFKFNNFSFYDWIFVSNKTENFSENIFFNKINCN
jgi:hypothetical protein